MAKKRRVSKKEQKSAPNYLLIGGLLGVFAVVVIGLLVMNVISGPEAAEPTPVLNETVASIAGYCSAHPDRCLTEGAADADATLVEISDYGCSHCFNFNRDTAPILHETFVEQGDLRVIILPYALNDVTAASSASLLCAKEQGDDLALAYHDELFRLQTSRDAHTPDGFAFAAGQISGLDVGAFNQCVEDDRYMDIVSLNRQAARQMGVNSTPTFFLNGTPIEGNQPLEVFLGAIGSLVSTEGS